MMNMRTVENYLVISDFCLAITLACKGFPVLGLDHSNPKRIGFQLNNSDQLQKVIQNYWEAKLLVSPQEFYAQQRALKARMYSEGQR